MTIEQAAKFLGVRGPTEVSPEGAQPDSGAALEAMRALMRALGDPQMEVPVIQVAGTNGKSSTATMISRLLTEMGLSVGTYLSPHVSSLTERIQCNGEHIGPASFAETLGRVALAEAELASQASWFELMTAAAYLWFADTAVDVAVVEVGNLGRSDPTSVVEPRVAVITNVGAEQVEGTENRRRAIATEQVGIVKPGTVLCLGEVDDDLEDVFVAAGAQRVVRRGDDFDCEDNVLAVGGRLIDIRTPHSQFLEVYLAAHGAHQGDNAAIAMAAAEAFLDAPIAPDVATAAFAELHLPGRFEILQTGPLVMVDGADDPTGAEAALDTLNEEFALGGRRVLVVSLREGRDARWMLEMLEADRADLVVACTAPGPGILPAAEVAEAARQLDAPVELVADPLAALDRALTLSTEDDLVLAIGSLALAGAIRDALASRDNAADQ